MKLGASYNVFDGVELLEYSIKSIRDNVDFVVVVYQNISNFREKKNYEPLFQDLKQRGLIDKLVLFQPNFKKSAAYNETEKRNIGLRECQSNGCTHLMSLDTDEFYFSDQLKYAKKVIEDGNYDSSACSLRIYYKYPEVRLVEKERLHVSLIMKIDGRKFKNSQWSVLVDPTRKMDAKKMKVFSGKEIEMHHFQFVRRNLQMKFNNSTSKEVFKKYDRRMIEAYRKYKKGEPALIYTNQKFKARKTEIVENFFNVKL